MKRSIQGPVEHCLTLDLRAILLSQDHRGILPPTVERKHSESSTELDSDDAHDDQLYADHDEDSDQGRPISPARGAEVQEISARPGYRHDSEQPSALSDAPAPTNTLYSSFYAHPRQKRVRLEGEFKWYRSEGDKPIKCPPARDEIDLKNPFQEADVVVHEAWKAMWSRFGAGLMVAGWL